MNETTSTLLHFPFLEAKKDEGTEKAARRQKREQRKKVLEKTQELSQKFGTLRSTGKIERLVSGLILGVPAMVVPNEHFFLKIKKKSEVSLVPKTKDICSF